MQLNLAWELEVEERVSVVFEAFMGAMWAVLSAGEEVELRALTEGPLAVGSEYIHVARHRSGRRIESEIKVESFESEREIAFSWSSGESGNWNVVFGGAGFGNLWYSAGWGEDGSRLRVLFTDQDTRVKIRVDSEHHLTGALVPVSFLMRWPAHRRIQKNLDRFKEKVERSGQGLSAGA